MLDEKKATILILDDMSINILLLGDILKDDYNLKISKSGEKALEIASTQKIDLALLDIEMPNMNGYEVCKKLKSNEKTKDIPIIFMSAKNNEEEEYGLNLGAIDYIFKPFSKSILKARIQNQIKFIEKTTLLEKLSMYDSLTNIKNRRYFDSRLEETYKEIQRDGKNLAIMMIDVDFFKAYNDNYGHGKGDEALKKVAKALENALKRPTDLVARYGGEEFVVLLKNINKDGLKKVALQILQSVKNENIEHNYSSVAPYITVSIGVALYDIKTKKSISYIIQTADDALYEVKNSGRDNFLIRYID